MGVFGGNQKEEPLNYSEVSGIWGFLQGAKLSLSEYQTLYNHAGDKDLKKLIQDLIQDTIKPEIERTEQVLRENGVELPPSPPERPLSEPESIPVGARFTDMEIIAGISASISAGLIVCSTLMGMSVREDIGAMFGEIHMKKARFGLRALRMMKDKGWLVTPPLHRPELAGARS
jgi:hypothetical protein